MWTLTSWCAGPRPRDRNCSPTWATDGATSKRWQPKAHKVGRILNEADRPALIAAAWLHDVGYAPSLAVTGFHPLHGARYVRALGHERIAGLVAHHSGAHVRQRSAA